MLWSRQAVLFAWWWSIGNLAMFSLWAVAKPNYFVPCLPGLALLAAMAWMRLCRVARESTFSNSRRLARGLLLLQCLILLQCGVLAPAVSLGYFFSPSPAWLAIIAVVATCGVVFGIWIWRLGSDVLAMVPVTAACTVGVLIGYGLIAPVDNPVRGHRMLARHLERLIPADVRTVHFFHEIDEGLWFYLPRSSPGSRSGKPAPIQQ